MHKDNLLKGRQRSVMLVLFLFMAVATFAVPASSDAEVLLYEGLSKYDDSGNINTEMSPNYSFLDYKEWKTLYKVFLPVNFHQNTQK